MHGLSSSDFIHQFLPDRVLVIPALGFASVQEYYQASSPVPLLPHLQRSTFILYAADDPLFDPSLALDLEQISHQNAKLTVWLTAKGGHVGYIANSRYCRVYNDPDPWWAWNRILAWCALYSPS